MIEFDEEGMILCPDCKGVYQKIVCPTCFGDKYLDWIEVACGGRKRDGFGIGIDPVKKTINVKCRGNGEYTMYQLYDYLKNKWRNDDELIKYRFPIIKFDGVDLGHNTRTMDVYMTDTDQDCDTYYFSQSTSWRLFDAVYDVIRDLKLIPKGYNHGQI